LLLRLPPRTTLFPYTTLFRSADKRSRIDPDEMPEPRRYHRADLPDTFSLLAALNGFHILQYLIEGLPGRHVTGGYGVIPFNQLPIRIAQGHSFGRHHGLILQQQ